MNTNYSIQSPRLDFEIFSEFRPFLNEHDLNQKNEIMFIEMPTLEISAFALNKIYIIFTTGLKELDKPALNFVLKHEIGHIKIPDNFWSDYALYIPSVILTICAFAIAIFFPAAFVAYSISRLATSTIIFTGIASYLRYEQMREIRADDFAIAHSTTEELQGGRRYFMACLQSQKEERDQSLFNKLIYDSTGEIRLVTHPSLKSRMQKIENELLRRNSSLGIVDWEKIRKIKESLVSDKKRDKEEEILFKSIESKDDLLMEIITCKDKPNKSKLVVKASVNIGLLEKNSNLWDEAPC
jgi:Zn-dependent protease with chaperone function